MAEETKDNRSNTLKIVLKVCLGIALLVLGAWLVWFWRSDVLSIIKGSLGIVIILAGVIALAIAKE